MNPIDSDELTRARDLLLAGEVVAIPTETVYGLAASIESQAGLRKIFSLKERPFFDPLIVHVSSFKQAASLTETWTPLADFLARSFWPGPLTLVLKKTAFVDPLITSGLDTVAIRMPSHPIALDIINLLDHPIAAPSANKFGRTSPSTAEHVRTEFKGEERPFIVDGGECEVGVESTVVAFTLDPNGEEIVEVLRPGGVTQADLESKLARWSRPVRVQRATSVASPGHLEHHYMPKIPLVIIPADAPEGLGGDLRNQILNHFHLSKGDVRFVELQLAERPEQAARELYSELRRLSEAADVIYVRSPGDSTKDVTTDLWAAIWDRLGRAASATYGA